MIKMALYPCSTVLDDSIGSALWFAARGRGVLHPDNTAYNSPAEVRRNRSLLNVRLRVKV